MSQPSTILIFATGIVGALAPEIVRLYNLRHGSRSCLWSPFYAVISMMFGGLGGFIALILPATTYYGAFYAGVATPILINSILRNVGAGKMEPEDISATRKEIQGGKISSSERCALRNQDTEGGRGRLERGVSVDSGAEIRDIWGVSGKEKLFREAQENRDEAVSSVEIFPSRRFRLYLHDFLNSL